MSILSNLKPPAGAKKKAFRVGRGPGSGNGKTAGRGQKGQGARSGYRGHDYFEGGQMPLQRRIPKRGFKNVGADVVVNVNVGQLDVFDDGAEITVETLKERGLIKGRFDRVKILGTGELQKKLTVHAHGFSASAAQKIEQAGGTTAILPRATSRSEGAEASADES